MRSVSRHAHVSINTVTKLLIDVGAAAKAYHDEHVRRIPGRRRIECCQTWAFSYRNPEQPQSASRDIRNAWTLAGVDADSRLIVSFLVGDESRRTANAFIADVRRRLEQNPELATNQLQGIRDLTDEAWRNFAPGGPARSDITLPMPNSLEQRRLEKHMAVIDLYALHYNFCRVHPELAVTPAMRAGLDDRVRGPAWMVDLVDARATKPNRPKTYRRRTIDSN